MTKVTDLEKEIEIFLHISILTKILQIYYI